MPFYVVGVSIVATLSALMGLFGGPKTEVVAPSPATAIIYQFIASPIAVSTSTPLITPGRLPTTTWKQPSSSVFGIAPGLLPNVKISLKKKAAASAPKNTIAATETTPSAAPIPKNISAQWLLDHTTLSLVQRLDSTYRADLSTSLNEARKISWNLGQTELGGSGGIQKFGVSYSCDTPPFPALPDIADQSPVFQLRTSYSCDISLTPTSGSDLRAMSKNFTFKTGGGKLKIGTAIARSLISGQNDSGFAFSNEDSEPVTVTGLTLNISIAAVGVTNPLVIRFADGKTGAIIKDYQINDMPDDPSLQFAKAKSGIQIPLSLTIKPNSNRFLEVSALGVEVLSYIPGSSPTISIDLSNVTLDRTDMNIYFNSRKIKWYCIAPQIGATPVEGTCNK